MNHWVWQLVDYGQNLACFWKLSGQCSQRDIATHGGFRNNWVCNSVSGLRNNGSVLANRKLRTVQWWKLCEEVFYDQFRYLYALMKRLFPDVSLSARSYVMSREMSVDMKSCFKHYSKYPLFLSVVASKNTAARNTSVYSAYTWRKLSLRYSWISSICQRQWDLRSVQGNQWGTSSVG